MSSAATTIQTLSTQHVELVNALAELEPSFTASDQQSIHVGALAADVRKLELALGLLDRQVNAEQTRFTEFKESRKPTFMSSKREDESVTRERSVARDPVRGRPRMALTSP